MAQITLVIDRQNRQLVTLGASVSKIPDLSQRDTVTLLVQIADPQIGPNGLPTIVASVDISAGSLRVTVSQKATGTAGDENAWLLAKLREADFTWDPVQSGFTTPVGLDLNTLQMQNFIGAAESVQAEFEVRFSKAGAVTTLLPGPKNKFNVWANADEGADPPLDILNGVPTLRGPVQIIFPSGNLYVIQESDPVAHTVSIDFVP